MDRAGEDTLAALLRGLRRQALLTQEEPAQRSGVSVGTIAGLENGRSRHPRPDSLWSVTVHPRSLVHAVIDTRPPRAHLARHPLR
jgi:DNA-binding XRE family transcriptional regulator